MSIRTLIYIQLNHCRFHGIFTKSMRVYRQSQLYCTPFICFTKIRKDSCVNAKNVEYSDTCICLRANAHPVHFSFNIPWQKTYLSIGTFMFFSPMKSKDTPNIWSLIKKYGPYAAYIFIKELILHQFFEAFSPWSIWLLKYIYKLIIDIVV